MIFIYPFSLQGDLAKELAAAVAAAATANALLSMPVFVYSFFFLFAFICFNFSVVYWILLLGFCVVAYSFCAFGLVSSYVGVMTKAIHECI